MPTNSKSKYNNTELKLGVILSYFSEGIGILATLFFTPVVLSILGKSEYGLYQTSISIVSYLSILNLGFQSAYQKFYSNAKAKDGEHGVSTLNLLYTKIFAVLTLASVLVGGFIIVFREGILGSKLTSTEVDKCGWLIAILVVSFAASLFSTPFSCYINSQEKFICLRIATIVKNISSPLLSVPILLLGCGSVGLVCITSAVTIAISVFYFVYAKFKLGMRFEKGKNDKNTINELFTFTFFIFINMIINQVNWELDKIILIRSKGAESIAEYSVGSQINTLFNMLSTSISAVFVPRINDIIAKDKNSPKINELFVKIGRIQCMVITPVLVGFALYGRQFIEIWTRGKDYKTSFPIAIILMIGGTVPLIQNIGIEIQRAYNKHRARSVVYAVIAVGNIALTLALVPRYSGIGAAIGTAVALILGNGFFMNYYYHKKLNLDIPMFWKAIIRFAPTLIPPTVVSLVLLSFFSADGISRFLIHLIIFITVYCISLYFFGLDNGEKALVKSKLERCIK